MVNQPSSREADAIVRVPTALTTNADAGKGVPPSDPEPTPSWMYVKFSTLQAHAKTKPAAIAASGRTAN